MEDEVHPGWSEIARIASKIRDERGMIVPDALIVTDNGQSATEFRNQYDPKGYHLEPREGRQWIKRNGRVQEELKDCPRLMGRECLNFAAVRDAVELLSFVRCYGALTQGGNSVVENGGDPVESLLVEARRMDKILHATNSGPPDLTEEMLQYVSANAGRVDQRLVWDARAKKVIWQSRVYTLYSALWAQLIQEITGAAQRRKCDECGCWFRVGPGTGRRPDARFCCDKHRTAFHNRARSKGY
jgi:hypothetical protein